MLDLYTKLKLLQSLNTVELLSYVYEQQKETWIKLNTSSGFSFTGVIVQFGKTTNNSNTLVLQLVENNRLTDKVVCIEVVKIESVELLNNAENILSQGKLVPKETYEQSGKLEVKREAQQLHDEVLAKTGVSIGVPQLDIPEDTYILNRYIKHIHLIKQTILELLAAEDAKNSWKQKYNQLHFVEAETLDVKGTSEILTIFYSFNNINKPLLNTKELLPKLMSIL